MRIEELILSGLMHDEGYARMVVPHLKGEYFHDQVERKIYDVVDHYIQTYNRVPSREAVLVDLGNSIGLSEDQQKAAEEFVKRTKPSDKDQEWRIDQTEKFCQDRALFNAVRASISIMDDRDGGQVDRGAIPGLLQDALSVTFDSSIGHEYLDDSDSRYDFYHRREERIPFGIEYLNKITKGGLPRKTMSILIGGIGSGKSLAMCSMAASNLSMGKNVLYITMELAEERVAERIDANLMDVTIDQLYEMPRDVFDKKIQRIRDKNPGRLVIKEYPTSGASSANFRFLLNELRIKKNFIPDVIYLDYLNICASARFKNASNVNSYSYVKAIAEEVRGLAVEFNIALITATQLNREGLNASDVDMTNTSESIGAPASADVMLAIIATEELLEMNQYMIKQLKNRFSDIEKFKRFMVGVDKGKMRLYDVDDSAQEGVQDSGAVFDQTPSGSRFDGFK